MPLDQVQTAVETFLTANWSTTPIAFENDGFQPPTNGNGDVLPWLLVELNGGLYEQRTLGTGNATTDFWSDSGTVWIHIFVASGSGSLIAKQYGSALASLFQGRTLSPNIQFGDITMAASGGTQDGNDWGLSLSIDWLQG
jgi:hypothetical protein